MACKTCKDPNIDSKYDCNACLVKKNRFMWCVITEVPRNADGTDADGNLYDCIVTGSEVETAFTVQKLGTSKDISDLLRQKLGMMSHKQPVYSQGEIIPVAKGFEREVCGKGRKPSKWDVQYELFPARNYRLALIRAMQATKEAEEPWTNLKYLARAA